MVKHPNIQKPRFKMLLCSSINIGVCGCLCARAHVCMHACVDFFGSTRHYSGLIPSSAQVTIYGGRDSTKVSICKASSKLT